jgi:ABC-type multidrug transport system ATPase subunit
MAVGGAMRRLKDEGHTVLISSHVLHDVEQICDCIAIINRGRVVIRMCSERLFACSCLPSVLSSVLAALKVAQVAATASTSR